MSVIQNSQFNGIAHSMEMLDKDQFLFSSQIELDIYINGPQRVGGYIIAICKTGKIKLTLDDLSYQGESNELFIMTPHQLLSIDELSPDCVINYIFFSKHYLLLNNFNYKILDKFTFRPEIVQVISLSKKESSSIIKQFSMIEKRFNDFVHPFRKEVISSYLSILLYDFAFLYANRFTSLFRNNNSAKEICRNFFDLMHAHLRTERKLEFYADKMCISTKYLSESLKKETGKTGSHLLSEAVVVEAQALLKQKSLGIKQIANILNFPNPSAFGKFFKKHTGYSPAVYRS